MKFRKSSETTAEIDSELKSTAEKIDLEIVNAIWIAVDPRQDPNLEILYLRIKNWPHFMITCSFKIDFS